MNENEIGICDECGSEFLKSASRMKDLCPECAHILYGYPSCEHIFKNGKCLKCFWNGKQSDYIKALEAGEDSGEADGFEDFEL